ncbi:glycosyltransferase [Terrimonas rubra]|uniref:Glycosyltransferase n=1 Tax=Terrimonas rubra TaxID=1035890 RepID=A0ABW6A263_9BACT
MKILHFIDSLGYGGAETLLTNYIPELKEHDHVIVTFSDTNFYREITNQYACYNLDGNPVKNLFKIVSRLKKIIAKENIDIVHSHSYWTNIISRLATPKRKKLINHYHFADFDTMLSNYKVRLQLIIDKTIGHRNLRRVAVSDYVYGILKQHFPKGQNSCLPNFVNTPANSELKLYPYTKGTPLKIVAVGNIIHEKGYDVLLPAFEKLKQYPIKMDVFGEGDSMEIYINELHRRGITALKFCGKQKSTPALLQQYDLYCSCSTSETFGIALIEAVAAGLPVLISDIPAFKEIAPDSAYFFKKADSDDFFNKVTDIYQNGITAVASEYKYLLQKYSKPVFLEGLRDIYQH